MLPELTNIPKGRMQIVEFKGYSDAPVIQDGEMRDMKNLSSDLYPILTQRKPRGIYRSGTPAITECISCKEKLAYIRGDAFFYDDVKKGSLANLEAHRTLVNINQKICIFPDNVYYDIVTDTMGSLGARMVSDKGYNIRITDNTLSITTVLGDPAEELMDFKAGDAVILSGFTTDPNNNTSAKIESINGSIMVFPDNTFDTEKYPNFDTNGYGVEEGRIIIDRPVPKMDYVIEVDNRLWGVGDNTIYSCALGDPTNWNDFSSIANASYAVTVGTDGDFTGICNATNHICFFKEHHIHRLYGSNKPSTYQIQTIECLGVEKGSARSIQRINSSIFYKSPLGIVIYDGSYPSLISQNFRYKYHDAVAGSNLLKYYVSMIREDGTPDLLVYDLTKNIWHIEDNTRAEMFVFHNGNLLFLGDGKIYETVGSVSLAETQEEMEWCAEFGNFNERSLYYNEANYPVEDKKIYNKIKIRLNMADKSEARVYIRVDDGEWELLYNLREDHRRAIYLPINPRRCDKFAIKLAGKGKVDIETLSRVVRSGSAHD